jgi:hypothetical protein
MLSLVNAEVVSMSVKVSLEETKVPCYFLEVVLQWE